MVKPRALKQGRDNGLTAHNRPPPLDIEVEPGKQASLEELASFVNIVYTLPLETEGSEKGQWCHSLACKNYEKWLTRRDGKREEGTEKENYKPNPNSRKQVARVSANNTLQIFDSSDRRKITSTPTRRSPTMRYG